MVHTSCCSLSLHMFPSPSLPPLNLTHAPSHPLTHTLPYIPSPHPHSHPLPTPSLASPPHTLTHIPSSHPHSHIPSPHPHSPSSNNDCISCRVKLDHICSEKEDTTNSLMMLPHSCPCGRVQTEQGVTCHKTYLKRHPSNCVNRHLTTTPLVRDN